MPPSFGSARLWPGIAAVLLTVSTLLPPAAAYARQSAFAQALQFVIFAVAVAWRLPAMVNALARDPALTAVELVTLLAAGTGIWLELTSAPQGPGQLPGPARTAIAAAAMWTIWVLAYLTGMSGASWFAAYRHGAPGGLSAAADQQIAVAILWAAPALCFLPVLFVTAIAWLGGSAGPAGSGRPAASGSTPAAWPRPPRTR